MSHARVALVPSYPAPDWQSLESALRVLTDVAPEFQIDIVDGVFVPAESWPFTDDGTFAALKSFTNEFAIEMDCMVVNPQQYLDTFVSLGVSRVIIHKDSTVDYQSCLNHAREHGYQIGIAVLPTEEFNETEELIAAFDYVQVMGIREVGEARAAVCARSNNAHRRYPSCFSRENYCCGWSGKY